jgi:hypothetical protein
MTIIARSLVCSPGPPSVDPRDENSKSKPLIEHEFALMKQLANVRLYSTRLYVHLPEDCDNKAELRQRISRKIKQDLPYFPFST